MGCNWLKPKQWLKLSHKLKKWGCRIPGGGCSQELPRHIYVSLHLRVQNAVPAQPCVGKYWISLILLNFLHCNFRLWFKTPQPFNSYPCHASEVTRNTLNHCLKFTVRSIFCHICYGKISGKNVNTFFKVKLFVSKTSDSCFKVLISFKCS